MDTLYIELAKINAAKAVTLAGGPARVSRALMAEYGLSVTRQCVFSWKRSRVPFKYLVPLAKLSGVPVVDLVPECAHVAVES